MTEFNLEKEYDDYSRSFGLCVTENSWGDKSHVKKMLTT